MFAPERRRGGKTLLELNTCWRKDQTLDPDWKVGHAYLVEVVVQPAVRTKLQILRGPDFVGKSSRTSWCSA